MLSETLMKCRIWEVSSAYTLLTIYQNSNIMNYYYNTANWLLNHGTISSKVKGN